MKKLFFSAVALVAFSSVSMANTIAVEKVVVIADNNVTAVGIDCVFEKFKAYNIARRIGVEVEDAVAYSYEIYFSCMAKTAP